MFARVIDKRMTWKHGVHVLWNWGIRLLVVGVVQLIWRQAVWIFVYGFHFVLKGRWIDLGWIVGLENWLQDLLSEIWIVVFHIVKSSHTLRYFLLWQTNLVIAFSVDAITLRYRYTDVVIYLVRRFVFAFLWAVIWLVRRLDCNHLFSKPGWRVLRVISSRCVNWLLAFVLIALVQCTRHLYWLYRRYI